jgi:hypothetical protein
MNLEFDLQNVQVTEFGVGLDEGDGRTYRIVPVGADVQGALREMVAATWTSLQSGDGNPDKFDPSEKYASQEVVYLPREDDLAANLALLHDAENLPIDAEALSTPSAIFCYFARMTDGQQRRLTAVHRASQFKGLLKSRNRLVRLITDSLQIVEDDVFKLDMDFDLLIDADNLHILRPSGFEFTGELKEAILAAAPKNIAVIRANLKFVDFDAIKKYAGKHPRAARYLASIRSQRTKDIDKHALVTLCEETGVNVSEIDGKVFVEADSIMGFLEVLDRRRYEVPLVPNAPERFRAASRKQIDT